MGVTLKQIAEMAGTHKSTVDKVIHNRPGVSDKKRAEIQALLKKYGYEANPLAKALNYQKRKLRIAVIFPEVSAAEHIKNGMELVLPDFQSFNIEVEYHSIGNSDYEEQARCIRSLSEKDISGAVIIPIENEMVIEAIKDLSLKKIPVIVVNSEVSFDDILCYIGQDMLQSGIVASRMMSLFTGGHAQVGIISCRNMLAHYQREQSFIDCVSAEHPGLHIASTVHIEETPEDAYAKTVALLTDNPQIDSLFITCGCVPDICRAVRDHKEKTGALKQPVIICYEKYPEILELIKSGEIACSLSGSLGKQGRLSMRLLFEYLVYDRLPPRKKYYFNNKITIRENC